MIYHGRSESLVDLEKNVRCVTHGLRDHADEYDFIAVSGMSGVVVGAPAALRLHKPLVIVRKTTDSNLHHIGGSIIGFTEARGRYIVLDDFSSTGGTLRFIRQKVDEVGRWAYTPQVAPKYVGYFSYADDAWFPESNTTVEVALGDIKFAEISVPALSKP